MNDDDGPRYLLLEDGRLLTWFSRLIGCPAFSSRSTKGSVRNQSRMSVDWRYSPISDTVSVTVAYSARSSSRRYGRPVGVKDGAGGDVPDQRHRALFSSRPTG